jgi:hypothetical protein
MNFYSVIVTRRGLGFGLTLWRRLDSNSRSLHKVSMVPHRVARWYIFKPKPPNLGKFWSALQWKILVNFTALWSVFLPFLIPILWPFGIFCGHFGVFFPVLVRRQPWSSDRNGIPTFAIINGFFETDKNVLQTVCYKTLSVVIYVVQNSFQL